MPVQLSDKLFKVPTENVPVFGLLKNFLPLGSSKLFVPTTQEVHAFFELLPGVAIDVTALDEIGESPQQRIEAANQLIEGLETSILWCCLSQAELVLCMLNWGIN